MPGPGASVTSCPSCGARVDAPPQAAAYVHTCRFCGTQIPIAPLVDPRAQQQQQLAAVLEQMREVRAEARAEARAAPAAAAAARAGRTLGCFITAVTLIPIAIPLFIFLGPTVKGFVGSRFGSFPIEVGMNDELEIADREASSTSDTLITMGINAKLTLRRCKLKGPLIIKAGTNATITIVDSTLEGTKGIVDVDEPNVVISVQGSTLTSGEEILDDGATNVKISVSKDSKLHADGVAFPIVNNGEVAIDHSTLEGKLGAIELKNNGKVKLTDGAIVKSDGTAIDLVQNGHLQMSGARVESKTTAVHAANNLEGTLRNATLIAPKAALDVGNNAHVTVAQSTISGPKLVPKYSTIDER